MKQYVDMIGEVLNYGDHVSPEDDRTGTGYYTSFGHMERYDLRDGFPLLALKQTNWHAIVTELLWFMHGGTNTGYLHQHGVHIWDEWASEGGYLGPIYGSQWRDAGARYDMDYDFQYRGIDQLNDCIEGIKVNPHSRRHVVNAWQVPDLELMALPPCHMMFHFNVSHDMLNMTMYQRSADLFLGVPFNVASYSLLLHIVAAMTGYEAGTFTHMIGDMHIYLNHVDGAREVLKRWREVNRKRMAEVILGDGPDPVPEYNDLCHLVLPDYVRGATLEEFLREAEPEHFRVENYNPMPAIRGAVAV